MATLHVICGKAGSGKTTLARELFHAVTVHFAPPTPDEGFRVLRRSA